MSFTTEILDRPTIKEITSYLLYGAAEPETRNEDYDTRLKNAFTNCENTLNRYDSDKDSDLYNAVYNLVSVHEKVYMEIGFQSGLLLMQDALRQQTLMKNRNKAEDTLHDKK